MIIGVVLGVAAYLGCRQYLHLPPATRSIIATRDNLERLCTQIDLALQDPAFRRAVGAGLTNDATYLPALDPRFKYGLSSADGRHPYHLKLTGPVLVSETGAKFYHYELLLWSDGPNGVNEGGKGDDVSLRRVVECPAE